MENISEMETIDFALVFIEDGKFAESYPEGTNNSYFEDLFTTSRFFRYFSLRLLF